MNAPKSERTIMFVDVANSTGLFESLGNEKAAYLIAKLTRRISDLGQSLGAHVLKHLGDGVLFAYSSPALALNAAVQIQRHFESKRKNTERRIGLQIGLAAGEVMELDGDTFGDAIHLASRLSHMAGADQIWCLESMAQQAPIAVDYKLVPMGNVSIRGRSEPATILSVEWKLDVPTSMLTVPVSDRMVYPRVSIPPRITLSWNHQTRGFSGWVDRFELGRQLDDGFSVKDPRVSRTHARFACDNGVWSITDVSSYGTWIWFDPDGPEIKLRRNSCVLHDTGYICLAAPYRNPDAVQVRFTITSSQMLAQ